MAAAYPLDTPERVLKRVHQLEMQELDLPSLPSFQHDDLDYETGSASGADTSEGSVRMHKSANMGDADQPTPHPLQKAFASTAPSTITRRTHSPRSASTSSSSSPYPPRRAEDREETPSPYVPASALTSTPYSHASRTRRVASENETRSTVRHGAVHERTRSVTATASSGNRTGREKWHTPGEMSGSFSGEEIAPDGVVDMGMGEEVSLPMPGMSTPLSDVSRSYNNSSETPLTRRLSHSKNVVLQRPGRRSQVMAPQHDLTSKPPTMPSPIAESPDSIKTAMLAPEHDRVPSLSRTDITQSSGGAMSPEGPSQGVAGSMSRSPVNHLERAAAGDGQSWDESLPQPEHADYEDGQGEGDDGRQENDEATPAPRRTSSRDTNRATSLEGQATPSPSDLTTPGFGREPHVAGQGYDGGYDPGSTPTTALLDVTRSHQDASYAPFTPSPTSMISKVSDVITPRAPLDDAQRRKSHVLAVLSSTGLPSRIARTARGTPHPLRHVLMPPTAESIDEEGTPLSNRQGTASPDSRSHLTIGSIPGNESFVSVASSADLTSDKRASKPHHLSRGNTSFPTLLLPTAGSNTSAGRSLRGTADTRADGVKIHKHLNAMNKQLLDSNAVLAREAEAWKLEVERLMGLLHTAGAEVEDVDVMARLANISAVPSERSQGMRQPHSFSPASSSIRQSRRSLGDAQTSAQQILDDMSPEEHEAIMQEMAEKLELLEQGMDEKDQLIADLEARLDAASEQGSNTSDDIRRQIEQLREQLEAAEQAQMDLHSEFAQKTELHAKQFGDICAGFEEQVKSLEKELAAAKADVERLKEEKTRLEGVASAESIGGRETELRKQVADLKMEVSRAKEEAKARAAEVESLKKHSARGEEERISLVREAEVARMDLAAVRGEADDMEARLQLSEDALEAAQTERQEAQAAGQSAQDEAARQAEVVAHLQEVNGEQEAEIDKQFEEIQHLAQKVQELQEAAESNERGSDARVEEELEEVRRELEEVADRIAEKEEEIELLRGKLKVAQIATTRMPSETPNAARTPTQGMDHTSSEQASFLAAVEERLDDAYREIGRLKHELAATPHRKSGIERRDARIKALEREKAALQERLAAVKVSATPGQTSVLQTAASPFGKPTPFVHRAIASLKTPKTPGPLGEVEFLQEELHRANDQLDHNFSRLEAAGLSGIALAEKMAAAEERIAELEDEIRGLVQRNKASLALVSAQKKENACNDEKRVQRAVQAVHAQLDELKADTAKERARLQKDVRRLQDLNTELRLKSEKEVQSFKAEAERLALDLEGEMKNAQASMATVQAERDGLRKDLHTSNSRVRELERNLADQRRQYDALTRRFGDAARSVASRIEVDEKTEAIRSLEFSLKAARAEVDRLGATLELRTEALIRAESRIAVLEKERKAVAADLLLFEQDMRAQHVENQKFGKELQLLKVEQTATASRRVAETAKAQKQCRAAERRLVEVQQELGRMELAHAELVRWKEGHQYGIDAIASLDEQKTRFRAQTRDLAAQIRYLKAKYTREATFRNALALQKRYLLLLVGGMSLNEQATLKAIASMGYPIPETPRPKRTLRAVGVAVLSLIRARRTAQTWREEKMLKAGAFASHDERRRASGRG